MKEVYPNHISVHSIGFGLPDGIDSMAHCDITSYWVFYHNQLCGAVHCYPKFKKWSTEYHFDKNKIPLFETKYEAVMNVFETFMLKEFTHSL